MSKRKVASHSGHANGSASATVGTDLLEKIRRACDRLGPLGWRELLLKHGLDIASKNLEQELAKSLTVDRTVEGFEDFAACGACGVEPGRPAYSLLYHAFASSRVQYGVDGKKLTAFPSPTEIEAVEDYVYSVRLPSLEDLRVYVGGAPLAIAVFAYEYRPAVSTVHKKHADMCYARTGVARVGTAPHAYRPDERGYLPTEPNSNIIRVQPCRYAAFIAAQLTGKPEDFGPLRFQAVPVVPGAGQSSTMGDSTRKFWVPLHKLFSGSHCIRGVELNVSISAHHFNQKLRKVHRALAGQGYDTGWHEPALSQSPFIYSQYAGMRLASFSTDANDGRNLLVPSPRRSLVELAKAPDGRTVTLNVPPKNSPLKSSLLISSHPSGARSAPEYVHVRHRYNPNSPGGIDNLNLQPNVAKIVSAGNYTSVHYLDFTADGWIEVSCPELRLELPQSLPAYSMVAPPDFFPQVDQLELIQWWEQSAPPELGAEIWPKNPGKPLPLCDMRYPANLSYRMAAGASVDDNAPDFDNADNDHYIFDANDTTITAIVASCGAGAGPSGPIRPQSRPRRTSMLPDGAAGIFAPGWDTSIDRTEEKDPNDNGSAIAAGTTFLTTYGLGSPFPEDAKLCAALSSFWPAAAPDITRAFEPNAKYATATPLTDEILGLTPNSVPWDGTPPRQLSQQYPGEIEYFGIDYGDYVQVSLDNRFDCRVIAETDAMEYVARTLVMARVFEAVGAKETSTKREWAVFSFRIADAADPDLTKAQGTTGQKLGARYAYRFELYRPEGTRTHPQAFNKKLVKFAYMYTFFADPSMILTNFVDKDNGPGQWSALKF